MPTSLFKKFKTFFRKHLTNYMIHHLQLINWNKITFNLSMKIEIIYEKRMKEHTVTFSSHFILLSKLGIGERRSIDIGFTSLSQTTTYPHMFFLSNGPPYPEIGLEMFIGPAIGVYRWVSTKIQLFGKLPFITPWPRILSWVHDPITTTRLDNLFHIEHA